MKQEYCELYNGDSSDEEDNSLEGKSYIEIIVQNIKEEKIPYKYTYFFKEIGVRVLRHLEVNAKYSALKKNHAKKSYKSEELEQLYSDIGNKYIVGKFLQRSISWEKYFEANKEKIENFRKDIFEGLCSGLSNVLDILEQVRGDRSGAFYYILERLKNYTVYRDFERLCDNIGKAKIYDNNSPEQNAHIQEKLDVALEKLTDFDFNSGGIEMQITSSSGEKAEHFLEYKIEEIKKLPLLPQIDHHLQVILSECNVFIIHDEPSARVFLANLRLYYRCVKGINKYCSMSGKKEINLNIKLIDMPEVYGPEGSNSILVTEQHSISNSGKRWVVVKNIATELDYLEPYWDILENLQKIQDKCGIQIEIEGSDFKPWFQSILKGKIPEGDKWKNLSTEFKNAFYKFSFLLFVCETTRNVGSLLTNAMFFDLVDKGIYSVKDLPNKLPMAFDGATGASLSINQSLGPKYGETDGYLSSVLHYDYRTDFDDSYAQKINKKDKNIFSDWVAFCKMGLDKDKIKDHIQELEKDMKVAIKSQSFCFEKEGYKVNLHNISIERDQLVWQAGVEKAPIEILGQLIKDWYGLEMDFLGEENIIFSS